MAGETSTVSLANSEPVIIANARQVRENPVGFVRTVDTKQLPAGTGLTWREVALGRLSAQSMGQTQTLDNPQEITDSLISVEPEKYGVHVILTEKVKRTIARNALGEIAGLMQNAIQRRKETDGLAMYDTASFSQPGAGNTLASGVMSALVANIHGNATEMTPMEEKVHAWLHPFQVHDLTVELGAPVGTYTMTPGSSQDAYRDGDKAITMVGGAQIHFTQNVRVDASDDAHGGIHAEKGTVLVEASTPSTFTKILENRGGAEAMWLYDDYGYVLRSSGAQIGRILSDALAPTS